MKTERAPARAVASATFLALPSLTAKAVTSSSSHSSTLWNAAALITTSGCAESIAPATREASVTSTSSRRGRTRSWRPSVTRARSDPSCPQPPNTSNRAEALPNSILGPFVVGHVDDVRSQPQRLGSRQDVTVRADDLDRLLEQLHPADVVVARVREIRVPPSLDPANHLTNRLADVDLGLKPQYLARLVRRHSVVPHRPIRIVGLDRDVPAHLNQRLLNPQGEFGDPEVAGTEVEDLSSDPPGIGLQRHHVGARDVLHVDQRAPHLSPGLKE